MAVEAGRERKKKCRTKRGRSREMLRFLLKHKTLAEMLKTYHGAVMPGYKISMGIYWRKGGKGKPRYARLG